jgi:hypothetical protein
MNGAKKHVYHCYFGQFAMNTQNIFGRDGTGIET